MKGMAPHLAILAVLASAALLVLGFDADGRSASAELPTPFPPTLTPCPTTGCVIPCPTPGVFVTPLPTNPLGGPTKVPCVITITVTPAPVTPTVSPTVTPCPPAGCPTRTPIPCPPEGCFRPCPTVAPGTPLPTNAPGGPTKTPTATPTPCSVTPTLPSAVGGVALGGGLALGENNETVHTLRFAVLGAITVALGGAAWWARRRRWIKN